MATITLSDFAVLTNGSVDTNATMAKFQETLLNYVTERETETAEIAAAVEAALDSNSGTRMHFDFLASSAARNMNAQNENFKTLENKIRNYVRENSCAADADGNPVDSNKPYHIGRGAGGGVGRWSDILAAQAQSKK